MIICPPETNLANKIKPKERKENCVPSGLVRNFASISRHMQFFLPVVLASLLVQARMGDSHDRHCMICPPAALGYWHRAGPGSRCFGAHTYAGNTVILIRTVLETLIMGFKLIKIGSERIWVGRLSDWNSEFHRGNHVPTRLDNVPSKLGRKDIENSVM